MAQVTNWIEHLTTDVDAATEGVQVADIYPMVGTEWMWLTAAIVFWLWFHVSTGAGAVSYTHLTLPTICSV